MLIFEFIGSVNKEGTGWIDFMKKELLFKLNLITLLGPVDVIESPSVIKRIDIPKGDTSICVQYQQGYDEKVKKERISCKPITKIYTTIPGSLIDELRSSIKSGVDTKMSITKTLLLNPRFKRSEKKKNEIIALARIFSLKPDGFKYLIVKC